MAGPGGTGPAGAPGEVAIALPLAVVELLPASWALLRDWATWYAPQRDTPLRWLDTHITQQLAQPRRMAQERRRAAVGASAGSVVVSVPRAMADIWLECLISARAAIALDDSQITLDVSLGQLQQSLQRTLQMPDVIAQQIALDAWQEAQQRWSEQHEFEQAVVDGDDDSAETQIDDSRAVDTGLPAAPIYPGGGVASGPDAATATYPRIPTDTETTPDSAVGVTSAPWSADGPHTSSWIVPPPPDAADPARRGQRGGGRFGGRAVPLVAVGLLAVLLAVLVGVWVRGDSAVATYDEGLERTHREATDSHARFRIVIADRNASWEEAQAEVQRWRVLQANLEALSPPDSRAETQTRALESLRTMVAAMESVSREDWQANNAAWQAAVGAVDGAMARFDGVLGVPTRTPVTPSAGASAGADVNGSGTATPAADDGGDDPAATATTDSAGAATPDPGDEDVSPTAAASPTQQSTFTPRPLATFTPTPTVTPTPSPTSSPTPSPTPSPTATPSPTPSPTPTPTETPVPPTPTATPTKPAEDALPAVGELLYNRPLSEWREEESNTGFKERTANGLIIGVYGGQGERVQESWTRDGWADIVASVDIYEVSDGAEGLGCLSVRHDAAVADISFCVREDGRTAVTYSRVRNGQWGADVLLAEGYHAGSADPSGGVTLSIYAKGNRYWFVMNGQLQTTLTHDALSSGSVAIATVGWDADDDALFEFRNLRVSAVN